MLINYGGINRELLNTVNMIVVLQAICCSDRK